MTTLDSLAPGQAGVIAVVDGSDAVVQRLLEMGLTDGETVEMVARAPLGDPLEISVRGYQLSLRAAEARRILLRT